MDNNFGYCRVIHKLSLKFRETCTVICFVTLTIMILNYGCNSNYNYVVFNKAIDK